MNIGTVKRILKRNIGVEHVFEFRGSRNQVERFKGVITNIYPSIFIIRLKDGTIRSYSYGDFVIHQINILS